MAESACLGGPGLVGRADASQAVEAGRKETPAELSVRRDLSHRPVWPRGSHAGGPSPGKLLGYLNASGRVLEDARTWATLQTKLTL